MTDDHPSGDAGPPNDDAGSPNDDAGSPNDDAGSPNGGTTQPGLRCPACGSEYAAGPDEPWRCTCGEPLEFAVQARPESEGRPPDPGTLDRDRGLWSFDAFLPVERRVTLGEGWTPLVDAADWDAAFKLEYVFPTGSFKDRGAATILSRAAALGVDRVLEDSSGNAGAAIATYAARAGIDARIFVPADANPAKLVAIERTGAAVERIEGTRQDVTDACVSAAVAGEGWYASHAWHPAFLAGTATFAAEVCAQRGWEAPDAVVCPLGHGTLFLGAFRGFRALADAGWIDAVPRLLGAQATGVAPIVAAIHGPEAVTPDDRTDPPANDGANGPAAGDTNDLADGIQIAEPVRRDEILVAIDETDGDVLAVGADATRAALRRLHEAGFYVEPTSAVGPAALELYRDAGVLDAGADVVVPLTGSGLKYEP